MANQPTPNPTPAGTAAPATHCGTTNTSPQSVVPCTVRVSRRVEYEFRFAQWPAPKASERSLRLPVAVAVDGQVKPEFARSTGLALNRAPIQVWVQPGQKVSLYLNSDAQPAYRQAPVFEITPQARDVKVIIYERRGRLGDTSRPRFVATREQAGAAGGAARQYDEYEAVLSGDVWLRVSHKYTAAEAAALLPAGTAPEVAQAIAALYSGTGSATLSVPGANGQGNGPAATQITIERSQNAADNIAAYDHLRDGVPRVHPNAWLAVIDAARAAGVHRLLTTSAWRPMLGSMAHRCGLGLDVADLDAVTLKRSTLKPANGTAPSAGRNVSTSEAEDFRQYQQAQQQLAEARAEQTRLRRARPPSADPAAAAEASRRLAEAKERVSQLEKAAKDAGKRWTDRMTAEEPGNVKSFRGSLLRCRCVRQVFDPWFVDSNTRDAQPPQPNEMKSANDALHKDHLHVTVGAS